MWAQPCLCVRCQALAAWNESKPFGCTTYWKSMVAAGCDERLLERHSEPIAYMANMSCHLQARSWIQHVWIWENFQTLPEGPRAGLKDSQIAYFLHIILATPIKLGSRSGTLTLRHAMNPIRYEVGDSRPRKTEGDSPLPNQSAG